MTLTPHSLLQNVGALYRIAVLVGLRPEANLQAISNAMQQADWPSALKRKDRDELQKSLSVLLTHCRTLGFIDEMGPEHLTCAHVLVPAALSWAAIPRFAHFMRAFKAGRIIGFDTVYGLATTKRGLQDRERTELHALGLGDEYLVNEATMMNGLGQLLRQGKLPDAHSDVSMLIAYKTVSTDEGSSTEATLKAWLAQDKKPVPGNVALFTQQPYGPRLEVEANAVLGPDYPCTVFAAKREDPLVAGLMSEISKLLHWLLTK